jgi:hypothetical protein
VDFASWVALVPFLEQPTRQTAPTPTAIAKQRIEVGGVSNFTALEKC